MYVKRTGETVGNAFLDNVQMYVYGGTVWAAADGELEAVVRLFDHSLGKDTAARGAGAETTLHKVEELLHDDERAAPLREFFCPQTILRCAT